MRMENNNYMPAFIVALFAAIAGAAIWAIIGILFNYEVGIIAWVLGGLSGYAVGFIAKQQVNTIHQMMAVVSALLGIVVGKYAAFAYSYNGKTIGAIFDSSIIPIFQKNLSLFFGGFDIIFVILAVVTSWQVPLQFKHAVEDRDEIHQHINDTNENSIEHSETENTSYK